MKHLLYSLTMSEELISKQVFFGELSIDMSETSELTVGWRWYDIEVDLEGSANSCILYWLFQLEPRIMIVKGSEPIYQLNIMDLEVIQVILHWMH